MVSIKKKNKKLKKFLDNTKKKISPTVLANQVIKIEADAQGMSVAEFKAKRDAIRKSQEEYQKTHWVADLTDAQMFFIATSKDDTKYMGKPLSKSNIWRLAQYKLRSKGFIEFNKSADRIKKLRDGVEKSTEPFRRLTEEYQALGKRLRSTFAPEQEVARKLSMGIGSLGGMFSMTNPLGFPDFILKDGGGLLDVKAQKPKPVDTSHGLNTLMKKHKMKSALDIPEHFLSVYKDKSKSDYFVENYGNVIALSNACGLLPIDVFKLICREVKKRKKHYVGQALIANGIACEELVNEFNAKIKKNIKYAMTTFFTTKFRKDWSLRHGYDWKNYKRFHEEFPNWLRIFNARAKKYGTKEDSDIDTFLNLQEEIKRGK